MPTEIQEGSPGSYFRPKSSRDTSAQVRTFKSPVYLKDGSRLSGVADNPEQNPFYGFDKSGQEFSQRREYINPQDITKSRDSDRTANQIRKELESGQKLFMPASEAGAGKGKQAEAAKRLNDLETSAKKDPLDNPNRNHLIQASLLEGIINESQGGAELDIRIGKHESGEGSRYIEYTSEDGDSFKIRATDHDRQLSSITNHRSPDFTLASDKKNVSESSGDWIDAIVKLENETDFRVPARLEDRIYSIINRRKEIQELKQEITKQERLAQEQARKLKEEAEANALETPKGKKLSDEINSIRLELQNSSGTGKYTKNQRKSMFKKVRKLEDELEQIGTLPNNRFMAPAAQPQPKLSERFR